MSELSGKIANEIKPKIDHFTNSTVDMGTIADKDPEDMLSEIKKAMEGLGMNMMFDGTIMKAAKLI